MFIVDFLQDALFTLQLLQCYYDLWLASMESVHCYCRSNKLTFCSTQQFRSVSVCSPSTISKQNPVTVNMLHWSRSTCPCLLWLVCNPLTIVPDFPQLTHCLASSLTPRTNPAAYMPIFCLPQTFWIQHSLANLWDVSPPFRTNLEGHTYYVVAAHWRKDIADGR